MIDHQYWNGKVAAITGGNSGIGRATAHRLHSAGARVAILGRDPATVAGTAQELPGALAETGDVRDPADLDGWYGAIGDRWGRIDALVVNASIGILGPMEQFAFDDLRDSVDVNVTGAYLTVQRALSHLGDGSSIVFVTSVNAELGQPGSSVYAATKAAQASMVKVFAAELLPRGIRVNGVRPGQVDTSMWTRLGLSDDALQQVRTDVAASVPLGRFATPDEIAAAIDFLAGPEAAYIVGEELTVAGGLARL